MKMLMTIKLERLLDLNSILWLIFASSSHDEITHSVTRSMKLDTDKKNWFWYFCSRQTMRNRYPSQAGFFLTFSRISIKMKTINTSFFSFSIIHWPLNWFYGRNNYNIKIIFTILYWKIAQLILLRYLWLIKTKTQNFQMTLRFWIKIRESE